MSSDSVTNIMFSALEGLSQNTSNNIENLTASIEGYNAEIDLFNELSARRDLPPDVKEILQNTIEGKKKVRDASMEHLSQTSNLLVKTNDLLSALREHIF